MTYLTELHTFTGQHRVHDTLSDILIVLTAIFKVSEIAKGEVRPVVSADCQSALFPGKRIAWQTGYMLEKAVSGRPIDFIKLPVIYQPYPGPPLTNTTFTNFYNRLASTYFAAFYHPGGSGLEKDKVRTQPITISGHLLRTSRE